MTAKAVEERPRRQQAVAADQHVELHQQRKEGDQEDDAEEPEKEITNVGTAKRLQGGARELDTVAGRPRSAHGREFSCIFVAAEVAVAK